MNIIKYLVMVICFCGLLFSCSNDPQQETTNTTSEGLASIEASTVIEKEDPIIVENPIIDSVQQEMDQLAEAQKEAEEAAIKKAEEKEIAAKEKEAKEKAASEERRAKRRAARKKKAAEAAAKKAETKSETKQETKTKTRGKASIEFKKTVHNYGRISQGEKVKYNFVFTNTGSSELVISNATASCGCTQPSFPFIPISPGEEGYIGVVFDSKGRLGRQKPKVTITTNANPATYEIFLEGTVDSEEVEEDKGEGTPE